jgi:hypothetical protein
MSKDIEGMAKIGYSKFGSADGGLRGIGGR